MNFKLIEIRQRTPPEVLVILSRSRASLTFLVLTAFFSFAAFMILKDSFPEAFKLEGFKTLRLESLKASRIEKIIIGLEAEGPKDRFSN